MKNVLLLLIACTFLLGSCEEELFEIDEENFTDNSYKIVSCHNEQNWTKEELEEEIIGEWEYVIGWCGRAGLIDPDFDKQVVKVEKDGKATIITNGDEEETTWEIIEYPEKIIINIENLGYFYLCGDKITTYASPRDGCDLTFSK